MPVVFRQDGFRFLFYADEGSPRESIYVHMLRDGIGAKFWLWPQVTPTVLGLGRHAQSRVVAGDPDQGGGGPVLVGVRGGGAEKGRKAPVPG